MQKMKYVFVFGEQKMQKIKQKLQIKYGKHTQKKYKTTQIKQNHKEIKKKQRN